MHHDVDYHYERNKEKSLLSKPVEKLRTWLKCVTLELQSQLRSPPLPDVLGTSVMERTCGQSWGKLNAVQTLILVCSYCVRWCRIKEIHTYIYV